MDIIYYILYTATYGAAVQPLMLFLLWAILLALLVPLVPLSGPWNHLLLWVCLMAASTIGVLLLGRNKL